MDGYLSRKAVHKVICTLINRWSCINIMIVRNTGDGSDPTAMEVEDGLCYSTWIKGQSIYPARIRKEPQKKAV